MNWSECICNTRHFKLLKLFEATKDCAVCSGRTDNVLDKKKTLSNVRQNVRWFGQGFRGLMITIYRV